MNSARCALLTLSMSTTDCPAQLTFDLSPISQKERPTKVLWKNKPTKDLRRGLECARQCHDAQVSEQSQKKAGQKKLVRLHTGT